MATSDPSLPEERRTLLVGELMQGRRAVGIALRHDDEAGVAEARAAVDRAKVALGERGPVWWHDCAPDLNQRMVAGTPYPAWFEQRNDPEVAIQRHRAACRKRTVIYLAGGGLALGR